MRLDGFGYAVSAQVTLTGAELAHLFEVGAHHYDRYCVKFAYKRLHQDMLALLYEHNLTKQVRKSTAIAEECAEVCQKNGSLTVEVRFTGNELNLMLKIMEMDSYESNPMPELSVQLRRIFVWVRSKAHSLHVLSDGTRVCTTAEEVTDWTPEAQASRKWGVEGEILTHHDSHGLCYEVRHQDGSVGHYDYRELREIFDGQE